MRTILKSVKRYVKPIIVLAILVFISILIYRNRFLAKAKKIETVAVQKGKLEQTLTVSGTVEAEDKVILRFQTSGRLSWVGVKEGDYVKRYQGIASLDQRDVEKTLKKKLLAYMNERWDFEQGQDDKSVRGRRMVDVPGLTDAERRVLDKAQFDLDSTVLDVEIAALAKEYSFLWTPIDGIVTGVGSPYAGVNITPATAEFVIINPDSVFFSANADQTEVTNLKEGMDGQLVLDSYPDETLSGIIKNVSFTPKAGETGTVYTVKFKLNDVNTDYKYRLGMGGDLTFVIKKKENVLYLPAKFISGENGKKFIKVKKNGKDEKVIIETGMETDTETEIIQGVKEGDIVYL